MCLKFFRGPVMGVFFSVLLVSLVFANASGVPLPPDARMVSQRSADIGPSQSFIYNYETSLSADRLRSFFKKEMPKAGWSEQKQGFYIKDNYLSMVVVMPSKNRADKTRFTVNFSRLPSKEDVLSSGKDNPDKLSFMPVYPGSKQVFLWDLPTGLSASYEIEKEIKDVAFFYKSGMLNYGWILASETPVTSEEIQIDCPSCQPPKNKDGTYAALAQEKAVMSKAALSFNRKGGERCMIRIFQSKPGSKGLISSGPTGEGSQLFSKKTSILVTYYAPKNN